MERPILTISMLVSGREKTTKRSLDSLQGLREQLNSELILVDTGCSESFCETLRPYTDQIIPFVWCNDFAKARNAGLKHATGEWFLFLDDDEWFEDVTPIVDFFRSGEYRTYEQAVYLARNYLTVDGSVFSDDWVSRMIRLRPETHFEGSVHESLVPALGKCKKIQAFVHHYGYAFADEGAKRAHYERNAGILKRLIQEEPDNLRWWLQIIPEYIGMEDSTHLIATAESALARLRDIDKPFLNQCRGTFYSAVLTGLAMEHQNQKLLDLCHMYRQDTRNSFAANAKLCVLGMTAAYELERPDDMADLGQAYFTAHNDWQKQQHSEQDEIIAESILLVNNAFKDDNRKLMLLLYAQALQKLSRAKEFPPELRAELCAMIAPQLKDKADFLTLPNSYWELGAAGLLPLEDILLALPLDQWMAQVCVLENARTDTAWNILDEHLQSIRTHEDIRYLYFAMRKVNARLCEWSPGSRSTEDANDAETILRCYAYDTLAFAKRIYKELAFDQDMALLPENIRGAVWIKRMLDCGQTDPTNRQSALEQALSAYPALKPLVQQYVKSFP